MEIGVKLETSLSCKWKYEHYIKLFDIINKEYTSYCVTWSNGLNKSYNLRSTCVCDIYSLESGIDIEFKKYIDSFIDGLLRLSVQISYRVNKFNPELKLRTRIKDPQSILDKIDKKSKINDGKFSINKILNDLLGIRVVDSNYKENIEDIQEYLNIQEYKVRHMPRIKEDYKGYHAYFKQDKNSYFPIELQIWDLQDEMNNYKSHEIYKEDYVNWTERYKET